MRFRCKKHEYSHSDTAVMYIQLCRVDKDERVAFCTGAFLHSPSQQWLWKDDISSVNLRPYTGKIVDFALYTSKV